VGGVVSGAGTCQRSSNASSLVIGIVRTTTVKGVVGESGSCCGSLFLLGCTKAAAPEQTHHKTIVIPVGNIGCSRMHSRALCALAQRKTNKKPARDQ
jgi:hypothetical protein